MLSRFLDISTFWKKFGIMLLIVIIFSVLFWNLALAAGGAQALGAIGKSGVNGAKATVWTAQQPNLSYNWIASPVGLCTTLPPCTGGFVETGYIKGDHVDGLQSNVLQQYFSWKPSTGVIVNDFNHGNLNDFTNYTFTVLSQPNNNRFVFRRDGVQVGMLPYDQVDFINGRMVACGAEANTNGTTIAVQCSSMNYHYNGAWVLFNYTFAQTSSGYCVYKPYDFASVGWGPC